MKESNDVTNLLARFSGDKATQYHEVREAEQQRETHERWPLFKQVRVGFDMPLPLASEGAPPTALSRRAVQANISVFAMDSPKERQAVGHETDDAGGVDERNMPVPPSSEGGRSLRSLFSRLENPHQPASVVEPLACGEPSRHPESIRSLFDRLRLP